MASLDKNGFVSLYSLVDRQVLFMSPPANQGMFYAGFLYHNKNFGKLLILRDNKSTAETLTLTIDKDKIAENFNSNV